MFDHDFSDPDVVEMVRTNHQPTEIIDSIHGVVSVICERCHLGWPCYSIIRYRKYKEQNVF